MKVWSQRHIEDLIKRQGGDPVSVYVNSVLKPIMAKWMASTRSGGANAYIRDNSDAVVGRLFLQINSYTVESVTGGSDFEGGVNLFVRVNGLARILMNDRQAIAANTYFGILPEVGHTNTGVGENGAYVWNGLCVPFSVKSMRGATFTNDNTGHTFRLEALPEGGINERSRLFTETGLNTEEVSPSSVYLFHGTYRISSYTG